MNENVPFSTASLKGFLASLPIESCIEKSAELCGI